MKLDITKRDNKTGKYIEVVKSFSIKDKDDKEAWKIANEYASKKNKSFVGMIYKKYYYEVEFNPD